MRINVSHGIHSIAAGGLTVALALLFGGQIRADAAWPQEEAIIGVIQTQADAWNRGDLKGFMAGYLRGPDLVFTSGGNVRRGWQITYDKYEERYGTSPETMGKLRFSDLEVHALGLGSHARHRSADLQGDQRQLRNGVRAVLHTDAEEESIDGTPGPRVRALAGAGLRGARPVQRCRAP